MEVLDSNPDTVLRFYLGHGKELRHSPNSFFDEAFFLAQTPTAAAAVSAGEAASGFDLYCRDAGRHRWPHWLFDEALYRERSADLTDEALQTHGLVNGYDHYLRVGNKEGRIASPFFDRTTYLNQLSAADLAEAEAEGPFIHYLRRLSQGGSLLRTTPYFDPEWYLQRYPDVTRQSPRNDGSARCTTTWRTTPRPSSTHSRTSPNATISPATQTSARQSRPAATATATSTSSGPARANCAHPASRSTCATM